MVRSIWFISDFGNLARNSRLISTFNKNWKKVTDGTASASEELLTVESFLLICKQTGLDSEDLETMSIGMCLDFFEEWLDANDKDRIKNKSRKASQNDFDSF